MENKFSIVVLTYNRKKFLARTLKSLFSQDFPASRYEVIVVDDCSTDDTEQVVKKFMQRHRNLCYIQHRANRGVAAARNTGIKNARYGFVGFVADDYIMPKDYLKIVDGAFKVDNGLMAINCNVDFGGRFSFSAGKAMVAKKEVFDVVGLFDENLRTAEDTDFGYRMMKKGIRIENHPEIVVNHVRDRSKVTLSRKYEFGKNDYLFERKHGLVGNFKILKLIFGVFIDIFKFGGGPRFFIENFVHRCGYLEAMFFHHKNL